MSLILIRSIYCRIKLVTNNKKIICKPLTFKNTPKFPSTKRDFSLLLDKNLLFDDIKRVALKTDNKILKSVELFDVYEGKIYQKIKNHMG